MEWLLRCDPAVVYQARRDPLGGGLITALSVPMILAWGSLTFGMITLAITAVPIVWGVWRTR